MNTGDFDRAMEMLTGMTAETEKSKQVAGAVTEVAANWLTPHYLLALQGRMAEQADSPERFKLMRKAARDVVSFQRGGLLSARLQLDREKLEFKRQLHQEAAASRQADGQQFDPNREWTEEEMRALVDKVDEVMGLKPAKTRGSRRNEETSSGGVN